MMLLLRPSGGVVPLFGQLDASAESGDTCRRLMLQRNTRKSMEFFSNVGHIQ